MPAALSHLREGTGHSRGTAAVRRRKVRATAGQYAPVSPRATRAIQWAGQRDATPKGGAKPQTRPQCGSTAGTRRREGEIPSNRASTWRGEYVPAPCTHSPSSHPNGLSVRTSLHGRFNPGVREGG